MIMFFAFRANDNSAHRNADGKLFLDFLGFIRYRRASSVFKCSRIYVEQMLLRICSAFKHKQRIYRAFMSI